MRICKLYLIITLCCVIQCAYAQKGAALSKKNNTDTGIHYISVVRTGETHTWGVDYNKLHISKDNGKNWQFENRFNFTIDGLKLVNDSVAILGDGHISHYTYHLNDHTLKEYHISTPLHSFLPSPIDVLSIKTNSNGCEYAYEDAIEYLASRGGLMKINGPIYTKGKNSKIYTNSLSRQNLSNLIRLLSNNASHVMTIKDFAVTNNDIQQYRSFIDSVFNKEPNKREFYLNIIPILDTISSEILYKIYNETEGYVSTSSESFSIKIKNKNGQVIAIEKHYYHNSKAWHLPWIISYDEIRYKSYDVRLSKYIKRNIPKDFNGAKYFSNTYLIKMIADYKYNEATH